VRIACLGPRYTIWFLCHQNLPGTQNNETILVIYHCHYLALFERQRNFFLVAWRDSHEQLRQLNASPRSRAQIAP
jgi:hypothetical protein